MEPVVSVICLCYNHGEFLKEALNSVFEQTYEKIQIIVIDDASTDGSQGLLKSFLSERDDVRLILNQSNQGNCKSFNRALGEATGKYIVDLATDDVMTPTRVARQVAYFQGLGQEYGVVYSDFVPIDTDGNALIGGQKDADKLSGNLFNDLVKRYFIAPPTMMIKKEVFDYLGGYDEELAYEDFDFWVRSSHRYKYAYLDEKLTKIRKVDGSLSTKFYGDRSGEMLSSTYAVCEKVSKLVRNNDERSALKQRISYEMRQSLFTSNFNLVGEFYALQKKNNAVSFMNKIIRLCSKLRLSFSFLNRSAKQNQ